MSLEILHSNLTMTTTSIKKRMARKIAHIFRSEVLDSLYSFNNVFLDDVNWTQSWNELFECNGSFPKMNGYGWDDDRHLRNGGEGHWSDKCTFFAWKKYINQLDESHSDYMICVNWFDNYIADGITKYWDGQEPNYIDHINEWGESCSYKTYKYNQKEYYIPIEVCSPEDETATDRMRREQYYTKHGCVWTLKDCICSTTGNMCNKTMSESSGYDVKSISYIKQIDEADDDDYVTCENCGNYWDGFAQCSCLGISISDDEDTIELTKLKKKEAKKIKRIEHERVWGGYWWECPQCNKYKIHSCNSEKAGLCLECYDGGETSEDDTDYSSDEE